MTTEKTTLKDLHERDFVRLIERNTEAQIWSFEMEGVKCTNPNSVNNELIGYLPYNTECELLK